MISFTSSIESLITKLYHPFYQLKVLTPKTCFERNNYLKIYYVRPILPEFLALVFINFKAAMITLFTLYNNNQISHWRTRISKKTPDMMCKLSVLYKP